MAVGSLPFRKPYLAYIAACCVASLAFLSVVGLTDPRFFVKPLAGSMQAMLIFTALAFGARLMAFRMMGVGSFSLDTPAYVAALVTLGPGATAWVVLVSMLMGSLVDLVRREVVDREHWPAWVSVLKLAFGPLLCVAIFTLVGLVLRPEHLFGQAHGSISLAIVWFVAVSVAVVALNFVLVGVSYRMNGVGWSVIGREVGVPVAWGETAMIPLGLALAIAFKERDLLPLATISVAYLIFNYIFRRMWLMAKSLEDKAAELALVEEVGRAAASTLDINEVGRRIGTALLNAVEGATGLVLTADGAADRPSVQYVRAHDRNEKTAMLEAVERSIRGEGTWLEEYRDLAPIRVYRNAPVGIVYSVALPGFESKGAAHLSLVTRLSPGLSERDCRVLASVSRQAAIALENWRLYNMATEDGLTGLFVRRYMEVRLTQEFERAMRSGSVFCLLMIDVDCLKEVNDRHGHAAGDQLLQAVAAAMHDSLRGMDVPCRWGGDEFSVLLQDMDVEAGTRIAGRLCAAVQNHAFQINDTVIVPSASVGVAAHPACGAQTPAELVELADRALYAVKKSGHKGQVVVAGTGPRGDGPTSGLPDS